MAANFSSAADITVSPLSESQNRLLSNEQHANNIGDHLANDTLKSGESQQGCYYYIERLSCCCKFYHIFCSACLHS